MSADVRRCPRFFSFRNLPDRPAVAATRAGTAHRAEGASPLMRYNRQEEEIGQASGSEAFAYCSKRVNARSRDVSPSWAGCAAESIEAVAPLVRARCVSMRWVDAMSVGHLLFAAATTAYTLVAIRLEERDLSRVYGRAYDEYREQLGMLLPWPW